MKISTDDENKKNSKKHLKINYYYKTSIMAFAAAILLFPAIGSNYGDNYSASAQVIYDDFSDNQIAT